MQLIPFRSRGARVLACVALVTAVLAGGATPQAHADSKAGIAVLGLEVVDSGGGIDGGLIMSSKDLSTALRKRAGAGTGAYTLVANADRMLIDLKVARECESEAVDCMAKIGEELKADVLLYGKAEKRSSGMQVSLKLFDVAKQKQIGTASDLIATADLTAAGLERASKALYAKVTGATASGSIIVTANVKEGSVLLDGTPTATLNAGSARLSGVAAGKHDVSIESPGYQPSTRSVTVDAGSDSDAQFSLEKVASGPGPDSGGDDGGAGGSGPGDVPPPKAPPKKKGTGAYKAAFVGSTVVGLAAGAMWAYSYTQIKDAEDQLAAGGNWNCTSPTTAEMTTLCKQGDDSKRMTWIMIPVTAAAGALAIYTFYKGFVQSSEGGRSESASARRRGKRKAQVAVPTITPTISPTGVGASVRIDF